jgi:DNA ligase-associated metallophosphoesterase
MHSEPFTIQSESFYILSSGAVFWPRLKALILSDLHLGKSGHFRKHGIPIPGLINRADLLLLEESLEFTSAERCFILGDALHSNANSELWEIVEWRKKNQIPMYLIPGNHDILDKDWYQKMKIMVLPKHVCIQEVGFIHDLQTINEPLFEFDVESESLQFVNEAHFELPYFSGHLHPKVLLQGKGRQKLSVPCLWIQDKHVILPAFGSFKGGEQIFPKQGDRLFAISQNSVHPIIV